MVFTFGKCYCDDSHKRSHFYSACLFLTSERAFRQDIYRAFKFHRWIKFDI